MAPDIDALNYPYIRVRSVNWLKRTLLIFPHVVRMSPDTDAPSDDPDVYKFCVRHGRRGPLLRHADLNARYVREAQNELIEQLTSRLDDNFRKRFAHPARRGPDSGLTWNNMTVWEQRLSDRPIFQIHMHKMIMRLVDFLMRERLAWEPEFSSHGRNYIEMHPRLGEAVMATLAFACAENEGLRLVTEFPEIHGKLIQQPKEAILSVCLEDTKPLRKASPQQVVEFIVYRRCDVSRLTAEKIAALKSERDALAEFRIEVEKLAATIPSTIQSEPHLEARLNDLINDIFKRWQRDQANLSAYARELFGEGALAEPAKLIQKLTEAAATPTTAAATAAGVTGVHQGNLTLGLATGAAAGFAVAVVFRAIGAWGKVKKASRHSPFRYLTTLAKSGVVFSVSR